MTGYEAVAIAMVWCKHYQGVRQEARKCWQDCQKNVYFFRIVQHPNASTDPLRREWIATITASAAPDA